MARVMVAMSGGVDSSVAAALLKEAGHEVVGVTMRLGPDACLEETPKACCGPDAVHDAARVAEAIGIALYPLNLRRNFQELVIGPFCDEYAVGRTPNPCVLCNRELKFGHLLRLALAQDFDYVATGHYAIIERSEAEGRFQLRRAAMKQWDQSYFLYSLDQFQMAHTIFPIGGMSKDEARQVARRFGLPVSEKPGSQDICFLSGGDYRPFLAERRPELCVEGPIVTSDGKRIGTHDGCAFYTVGQRTGLGVATGERVYILALRPDTNTVVVGPKEEAQMTRVRVENVAWTGRDAPDVPMRLGVKVRYRQRDAEAVVEVVGNGVAEVGFDEAQLPSAPGQAAVFYDGEVVAGGGVIVSSNLSDDYA
ncbi:MAG TPA: tRNA 2-thiouridine(34) synthase MnmA [Candidatus Brocadiia bacterium]|nr:tRNA 2-thiouridine(34) synthase MnmA [Candidatus Brocadiia bacterium]